MRYALALIAALMLAFAAIPTRAADDGNVAAVEAIHAHAGAHRLVLLGEFHGTREIPRLVGELVARYTAEGPVQLALEIPRTEQRALDAALAAASRAEGRRVLMARTWWQARDIQHDGRRSRDMLDLVERLRRLRAAGRDVRLLAYDVRTDAASSGADARDRAMAARLRTAYAATPTGRLVVLAGNVHAMLERPDGAPPQMQTPMGHDLRNLDPVSVRITARSGAFWGCPLPRRCSAMAADGAGARTGPMSGTYTFGVVLDRFRIARLIGAPD